MPRLSEIRFDIARRRADLRAAQDELAVAKAQAEQRAIDAAGGPKGIGPNKEDRERALTIALGADPAYLAALDLVRQTEADLDYHEAELREVEDERRASEWAIRARLVDALFGRSDSPDSSAADELPAFDAMPQAAIDAAAARIVELARYAAERDGLPDFGDAEPGPAPGPAGAPAGDGDDRLPF